MPFSPQFSNPLLVKEITITTQVSPTNALRILSVCTNIETLRFLTTMASETSFENDRQTASILNNLKNLSFLEIGILTFLDRNSSQKSRTFDGIVGNENVVLPSLKILKLAFIVLHYEWLNLFKFMSRHAITLKCLNTMCPCGERLDMFDSGSHNRHTTLPRDITIPQLNTLAVNYADENYCSFLEDSISLLLTQQKQLRRYETDISCGATLLKEVIDKNHTTIRILKLGKIGNVYSDELDCDIFRKCLGLQELSLRFDWGYVIVVNVGGGTAQQRLPLLYNLEALPKSLQRLTLCGTQIPSKELLSLFSQERILEEVTLGRADSMKAKDTGMTTPILMKMLENLVKLKKFRIFLDMICERESNEVCYCNELNGVWLQVWEIAKEVKVVNLDEVNETEGKCCGNKYNDVSCLSHRPFIDMGFQTPKSRVELLNRMKQKLVVDGEFEDEEDP